MVTQSLHRKISLLGISLSLALCACAPLSALAADPLTVKTDHGKVHGKASADGSVRIFLGVPFAAPPVGALRWKAPQPAAQWHGVRDATAFGYRCMQPALYADMIFHDPGVSEDCLTLNVWTPAKGKHPKLPVMVWIYGGGFITGSTSEARQDGENLARNGGVIVVSMNYRLGIFGFFAHHELAAENEHHAAGNYGLMDQSAALMWVKQNIAQFGGDPQNVTIFGESAGSFSVSAQMASPLSKDLIAKAIGESGGAFSRSLSFPPLDEAVKANEEFASRAYGTKSLAALRALTAQQLLDGAKRREPDLPRIQPDVDGYFLPESVPSIYAQGKQAKVPLLAGWNRDEGTEEVVSAPEKPTVASLSAMAQKEFGPRAPEFLRAYAAADDEEALRVAEDYSGDDFIVYSTWAWLEAQVKTGDASVFRYEFDRPSPGDPNHPLAAGAFHSDDIEYVFGVLDSRKGAAWQPEDYQLSKLMQTYWTNFAKTGDPNGIPGSPDIPAWPRYAPGKWQVMHLDAKSGARPDAHRDRYLFLQSVWSHRATPPAN